MKHFIFSLLLFFSLLSSCTREEKGASATDKTALDGDVIKNPGTLSGKTDEKLPEITFETLEHDFGKIIEGEKKQFDFKFSNTGEAPLIISNVSATCGCTVPDWPRNVIKPGESDVIQVVYNSAGHPGQFSKGVVVTANTYPNLTTLKVSGVVFKK